MDKPLKNFVILPDEDQPEDSSSVDDNPFDGILAKDGHRSKSREASRAASK